MYHIKKDKRSIQSSKWIYAALVELIKEKKYTDITITELVEKAKLGRSTFYRNFDFIDDVLYLMCEKSFEELYIYLLDYYKNNSLLNKSEKMVFLKPFLRYWYDDSSIVEILINSNRLDIFTESFTNMVKLFSCSISKSQGILSEHMDYFIAVRSGVVINVLTQWIKNGKKIAPDILADIIVSHVNESLNLDLLL